MPLWSSGRKKWFAQFLGSLLLDRFFKWHHMACFTQSPNAHIPATMEPAGLATSNESNPDSLTGILCLAWNATALHRGLANIFQSLGQEASIPVRDGVLGMVACPSLALSTFLVSTTALSSFPLASYLQVAFRTARNLLVGWIHGSKPRNF